MFGSTIFDVVLGLLLMYLLLSIAVSAFIEVAEGLFKRRSKYLRATLHRMAGSGLADELYQTSWIQSLSNYSHGLRAQFLRRPFGEKHPSYIPSEVFVEALREIVDTVSSQSELALQELQADGDLDEIIDLLPPRVRTLLPEDDLTAVQLRSEIEQCREHAIDEIVDLFPVGVLDDLDDDAYRVRRWYDHTMDRMSGWYSRQTKWLLFIWGLLFALVLNVDTFTIASSLWTDDVTRATAVSTAEAVAQVDGGTDCVPEAGNAYSCVDDALANLEEAESLGIPIGWPDLPWNWDDPVRDSNGETVDELTVGDDPRIPQGGWAWVYRLAGITVTAGAIMMGAPFWFDLINRFVNFRASGPKPERTTSELSQ